MYKRQGYDKIALISDHLMGGLPDGDYDLPLGSITVKDGLSRVKGADPNQDNTIAGSCFLSNVGVRTVVQVLGYPQMCIRDRSYPLHRMATSIAAGRTW